VTQFACVVAAASEAYSKAASQPLYVVHEDDEMAEEWHNAPTLDAMPTGVPFLNSRFGNALALKPSKAIVSIWYVRGACIHP
jgi:hypothetical protein